jgi:hypothetical protein
VKISVQESLNNCLLIVSEQLELKWGKLGTFPVQLVGGGHIFAFRIHASFGGNLIMYNTILSGVK